MSSSFKERFAQVAPVRVLDHVRSGSPAAIALELGPRLADVRSVSATLALARRGIGMAEAKRAVEKAIETRRAAVELPRLESAETLASELRESGFVMQAADDHVGATLEDEPFSSTR